ncbi:MAG: hypothetical protein ACTS5I_11710 [Rhodanobacter sp.]
MYRFLPGEFNFCLAGVDMYRGRTRSALEMLQLAAGWGSKKAQYVLGVTHFRGDSIPADHALGLAWLALAAERHNPTYLAVLASAKSKSTPAEQQHAAELLVALEPKYADAVAARRAQRRFDRMMRELTYFEPFDVGVCIRGLTGGFVPETPEESFTGADCPSPTFAAQRLHQISDVYFDGWAGHVSVGAIQTVPATTPARSMKKPGGTVDK